MNTFWIKLGTIAALVVAGAVTPIQYWPAQVPNFLAAVAILIFWKTE